MDKIANIKVFRLAGLFFLFLSAWMISFSGYAQVSPYVKESWFEKSIANEGDWYLLKQVFNKIEKDKKLTIGIIGGSITAGAASSDFGKTSWGPLVHQWFKEKYPDATIEFYNAGIGATNSVFGVHRIDQDLLRHRPDLVMVEFSVNDMHTPGTKMSYEGLIRKLLCADQQPAVLGLGLMTHTGENWQSVHLGICRHYRVPYISYRDAVYPEIEKDNITWDELYPDEVHPNDKGHQIISDLVIHFLEKVEKSRYMLPEPVTANRYENSYIYAFQPQDNRDWHLKDLGWETSRKGKALEFTITASRVSVMYNRNPEKGKAPEIFVEVDGRKKKLDTWFENGWGEYMYTDLLLDEVESGKHTIRFEYTGKPGKKFILHKILVTP
ncbi:MAG: SGNH/GDSL hydrolase family protein [Candidatus Azobacteroides sp.]|nr:SGNH/GDSL hydrolase family protein [Candidatus Azobacteroides sp.]